MKKYVFVASLVFILALLAGCTQSAGLTLTKKLNGVFSETDFIEKKQIEEKTNEKESEPKKASFLDQIKAELIPKGKPEYSDWALHFDAQLNSLNKMIDYENEIILDGKELEQYKKIASQTFCEFCCGPIEIEKCGCRHAQGYRGIVKFLVKNYPEYSDEKIIEEQEKWKASFFQKGAIFKYLKEQKALEKVSEEEIQQVEEMIGAC
ncbi:MAG: hypothetical protein HYW50_05235 [Candidatus Diapherotrites archaeon]|nr:hypothetical protein [Candidatus Diapherotrites archaeon]